MTLRVSISPSSSWAAMPASIGRLSYRHVAVVFVAIFLLLTFYHVYDTNPYPHLPSRLANSEVAVEVPEVPLSPSPGPLIPTTQPPSQEWSQRADKVKQAFLHAYRNYETYASPHDELLPVTAKHVDNFNGWGVTMVDSLDTMILMGLHEEFARALQHIERLDFSLPPKVSVSSNSRLTVERYAPFFETVIRYLGGLLSAYALTHEPILLQRADDLAAKLDPVFNTTSGLPTFGVNPDTGHSTPRQTAILAEIASYQVEYAYLAHMTGKTAHYDRTANLMHHLVQADVSALGMLPKEWNLTSGKPMGEHIGVGAAEDSAHEYLLKLYLLTGKSDQASLDLYVQTANRILSSLLFIEPNRGLLYVTDTYLSASAKPMPSRKFEHLSCFLPGLLALGAHTLPSTAYANYKPKNTPSHTITPEEEEVQQHDWRELHMLAAKGLGESCYLMYADQPTGLGPDEVLFPEGEEFWMAEMKKWRAGGKRGSPPGIGAQPVDRARARGYTTRAGRYLLRPETVESIFILWKTTGDVQWRERGWAIFEALERTAKTPNGFASVNNVGFVPATHKNEMPSYFLAETLKYLFLLFHEEDLVPLDRWVFNTEAHPLPVFEWSSWERTKFGIA